MFKFILFIFAGLCAMVASLHTLSFLFAGQYLLAAATSVFLFASLLMVVDVLRLGRA